jgi:hypothetical protein
LTFVYIFLLSLIAILVISDWGRPVMGQVWTSILLARDRRAKGVGDELKKVRRIDRGSLGGSEERDGRQASSARTAQ